MGHVSGVSDGSRFIDEDDCDLWFTVYQTDSDGDGLTWWEETNVYGTNPSVNNIGTRLDGGDLPIEWEDANGLNPLDPADDLADYDHDGLSAVEEYQWRDFGTRPTRVDYPDIIMEIDYKTGHTPQASTLKDVVDYFRNRQTPAGYWGVNFYIYLDNEIPAEAFPARDAGTYFPDLYPAMRDTYRNPAGIGVTRYCLVGDAEEWTYNWNSHDYDPVDADGYIVLGWSPDDLVGDEIVLYDVAIDTKVDSWNWNHWDPSDDVTRARAVAVTLMHELAHCLGVGVVGAQGEVYCEAAPVADGFGHIDCIMSGPGGNLEFQCDEFYFCDAHWAQLTDIAGGLT
jgi:hypothetical protein